MLAAAYDQLSSVFISDVHLVACLLVDSVKLAKSTLPAVVGTKEADCLDPGVYQE